MARILVVDDSLSVRKALEKILNTHTVRLATSAEDALAQLEQAPAGGDAVPDLMIIDIVMPGLSGTELARALQHRPALAAVPVVLMSGILDDDVQRQAQEVGAQAVVRKPFSAETLLPVIQRAMQGGLATEQEMPEHAAPQPVPADEPELDVGTAATPLAAPVPPPLPHTPAQSVEALLTGSLLTGPLLTPPAEAAAQAQPEEVPPVTVPPAPQPPAPLPPAAGGPDFGALVQTLTTKSGVQGALVCTRTGLLVTQAGELTLSADDLGMYARFFANTASTLGGRLRRGQSSGIQLDYAAGTLLLLPLDAVHLLACLLEDANTGSVVRFAVRRHLSATPV